MVKLRLQYTYLVAHKSCNGTGRSEYVSVDRIKDFDDIEKLERMLEKRLGRPASVINYKLMNLKLTTNKKYREMLNDLKSMGGVSNVDIEM